MNNSISYIGDVNIKQIHKGIVISDKEIHNAGSNLLFKFLCSALCSNNEVKNFPHYLDMVSKADGDTKYSTILNRRVQITERIVVEEQDTYKASLQISIPAFLVEEKGKIKDGNYKLRLYSDGLTDVNNYLAEVDGAEINLANQDVIVITWKMYFSNASASNKEDNNVK